MLKIRIAETIINGVMNCVRKLEVILHEENCCTEKIAIYPSSFLAFGIPPCRSAVHLRIKNI